MISFLCPTRGRPKQAISLYKSFMTTQSNENELLFCIQKEDDLYQEYINIFKLHGISKYFTSESMPTSYLWNQMAFSAKGDLLTLIGDDVEIKTPGWDERIEAESKKFSDNIYVITVDDGRKDKQQGKFMRCPHPTVHKKWVEVLGYFVPPFFMHRYLDRYTQDLAIKIGRYIEIKDIIFNHLKFNFSRDATGIRSRNWINYDKYIYEKVSSKYFAKDLEILRNNI
tara:strand:- start:1075 stop:1752 length:678 start_codon:yes stop_codon:yes gene_type:complete